MNSYHRQVLASSVTVLPAEEIDYDKLTRPELLSELRAMRIVLAHAQERLDSAQRRERASRNLEVAYRAALEACERAEAMNLELQRQIAASKR